MPRTAAVEAQERAVVTYQEVVDTFKSDRGREAKALQAMLGGDKVLYQRFLATTFALLAKNSMVLAKATPLSLVQSIKDAAALGLEPLTDDGAIVVYGTTATFQPMYRGMLKRMRNSHMVQNVDVQLVRENDTWAPPGRTERGATFTHIEAEGDRGGYRLAYAYALMPPDGFCILETMSELEINQVRDQYARGTDKADSPWRTAWGEMARKTVLRKLMKRLPGQAVDALLQADNRALEASSGQAIAAAADARLDEVRQLALRAVGALEAGPIAEASAAPETAQAAQDATPVEQSANSEHEQQWGPLT